MAFDWSSLWGYGGIPGTSAMERAGYPQTPGLLGTQGSTDTGLLGQLNKAAAPFGGLTNVGLALLANSGYSPVKRSLGEIVGTSLLQSQQMGQQRQDADLMKQYRQAQIEALGREKEQAGRKPIAVVGPDGKPIYVPEQDAVNRQPFYPGMAGDNLGNYQPGDYTPESWAQFLQSKDASVLKRYVTPRQEFSPSFQNVTRTLPDGSTQQGTFNTRTGQYDWQGSIIPGGTRERVGAQGKAIGEAQGGQVAKQPTEKSLGYVIDRFDKVIEKTPQGGLGGVKGKIGAITNYDDAKEFDNLREQLSTELRTNFRIPGEGTLSDQEQRQYGVQLPSRDNPAKLNRQILKDLKARTSLRINTPILGPEGREVFPNGSPQAQQADFESLEAEMRKRGLL